MLSDQPIRTAKDDLLGRAAFAGQIASAMLSCRPGKRGSFVFGLYGKWGSGKTSVLNIVDEAMRRKKAPKPILIHFNPWDYPAEELLPGQLLQTLADDLRKSSRGERLNKAARAMEKYASSLESCLPNFKSETLAELRGEASKKKKKKKKSKNRARRVMQRKAKVVKLLKKQKQTVYIVMDDIDRLSSQRILNVLQLVKSVASFPRFVYLLAFDREVVVGALSKELYGDGQQYMEKFIQLQFDIPAPEPGRIQEILMAYISMWLETYKGLNFDRVYFDAVAPFLFGRISTIRDVYRFINTFQARYQALQNEVNFVDLLCITAVQLFVPQAMPWLQSRRDDLLRGGGLHYSSADAATQKHIKAEYRQMIAELDEPASGALAELIGYMFPRFGKQILDVYVDDADPCFIRMRRICCEEFFDLYFTQSLNGLVITQKEMMKVICEMDSSQLRAYTDSLTGEERRAAFLNHLPHYLDDIAEERLPLFLREVLWLSRLPESKTPADKLFQRTLFQECSNTALKLLAHMQRFMREECLAEAVANASKLTLPVLVSVLTAIRRGAPGAESIAMEDDHIAAHLRQLLTKIHSISLRDNWLLSHKPLPVLEYWYQADGTAFKAYFETLMEDDQNAARLISILTQRFDSGDDMEYQFGDIDGRHAFSDLLPREDALAAILRLKGTRVFRTLPEDVRLDCVAFSLLDYDLHRATQADVLDAYPAWIKEIETDEISGH